jgi:hypothetical protein
MAVNLYDYTIIADDKPIRASRFLLYKNSGYFRDLHDDVGMGCSYNSTFSFTTMNIVVKLIMTHSLPEIDNELLLDVLKVLDYYRMIAQMEKICDKLRGGIVVNNFNIQLVRFLIDTKSKHLVKFTGYYDFDIWKEIIDCLVETGALVDAGDIFDMMNKSREWYDYAIEACVKFVKLRHAGSIKIIRLLATCFHITYNYKVSILRCIIGQDLKDSEHLALMFINEMW